MIDVFQIPPPPFRTGPWRDMRHVQLRLVCVPVVVLYIRLVITTLLDTYVEYYSRLAVLLLWAASQHCVKIVYQVVSSSKQDQLVVIMFLGVEGD